MASTHPKKTSGDVHNVVCPNCGWLQTKGGVTSTLFDKQASNAWNWKHLWVGYPKISSIPTFIFGVMMWQGWVSGSCAGSRNITPPHNAHTWCFGLKGHRTAITDCPDCFIHFVHMSLSEVTSTLSKETAKLTLWCVGMLHPNAEMTRAPMSRRPCVQGVVLVCTVRPTCRNGSFIAKDFLVWVGIAQRIWNCECVLASTVAKCRFDGKTLVRWQVLSCKCVSSPDGSWTQKVVLLFSWEFNFFLWVKFCFDKDRQTGQ